MNAPLEQPKAAKKKDEVKYTYVNDPLHQKDTGDFLVKDAKGDVIVQIPKDEVTLKVILDTVYKIGYLRGLSKGIEPLAETIALVRHFNTELTNILDLCRET